MMTKNIDFNSLLKDLFQDNVPVKEKVQEVPKDKRNGTDFSKALGELFQPKKSYDVGEAISSMPINEADTSPLQACSLYVFMKEIIIGHFGMGDDYAFTINDKPVLSWFTIPEAIEAAKNQGYRLTIAEARTYLDILIGQKYIQTDGYKYRRCDWYDKQMETFLQRYGR